MGSIFFATALVVLLPVIPAFLLFKYLPSTAIATGPFNGLNINIGGAFGGYVVVLLAVMSFFHTLPTGQDRIYTIKGVIMAPGNVKASDFRLSFQEDAHQPTPDLAFRMNVLVPPGPNGKLKFPPLLIEHPLFDPITVQFDPALTKCKDLQMKTEEVVIPEDCISFVKRETPAFETPLQQIPEH